MLVWNKETMLINLNPVTLLLLPDGANTELQMGERCYAKNPWKKAALIEKLAQSPRTSDILSKRGAVLSSTVKKKLTTADALLWSVKKSIEEKKAKGGSHEDKKLAHETLF